MNNREVNSKINKWKSDTSYVEALKIKSFPWQSCLVCFDYTCEGFMVLGWMRTLLLFDFWIVFTVVFLNGGLILIVFIDA